MAFARAGVRQFGLEFVIMTEPSEKIPGGTRVYVVPGIFRDLTPDDGKSLVDRIDEAIAAEEQAMVIDSVVIPSSTKADSRRRPGKKRG